jgi:hypothetical protein
MKNYHTSYKMKKRRRINEICAKMRAGKERKRLEQDYTPCPDRPNLCMQVIVREFECSVTGAPAATTYHLQACPTRRDSYWIWEGKTRLPQPMGRAQFFRRYLTGKYPRVMPGG